MSMQVDIMVAAKAMADVITVLAVGNVTELATTRRISVSPADLVTISETIKASVEQGYGNAASNVMAAIGRHAK